MDIATSYGLSYGLALSSGVNAYFPLLAFAVSARWLHLYKVNPAFSFVTQSWFMALLLILALADLFADKIPIVDHLWDAIHTAIRPLAGALVAAASDNSIHIPNTTTLLGGHQVMTMGINLPASLIVVMVIGAALALMTHTAKAATRVASTATTAGLLNIVLSVVEDVGVVITTLLALFAPVVMFVIVIVFVVVFVLLARTILRLFNRRRNQRVQYR